jgi:hypothetical protein
MMIKLLQSIGRAVVVTITSCGLLLFFFLDATPASSPSPRLPNLVHSVWQWGDEQTAFVLTFTQQKPESRALVAVLKGWGDAPLELRGEYLETKTEPQLQITGSDQGQTMVFDLKFNPGSPEEQPSLYGKFSVGSNNYSIYAGCDRQCPDIGSRTGGNPSLNSAALALAGEWQDISGEIGFKEFWSISLNDGQWQVSGKFIKDEEVVGSFHGEDVSFDTEKGVLSFAQFFDEKPDESWLPTNQVEAIAEGDTLKIKIRGVEAILKRAPRK